MELTPLRLSAAAAALVAVLVVAGCGSSGSSSSSSTPSATQTWANGLCSAITTYSTTLKETGATLKAGNYSTESLDQASAAVKSATSTLSTTLQGLGRPNTVSGAVVHSTLATLATSLQADAQKIKGSTAGESAVAAVADIGTALAAARAQITSASDALKQTDTKGELADAIANAPSCSALQ